MKTLYLVSNWNKLYENNRSRTVERLGWVPIPNSHDGERYSAIWTEPDGAQLFAAWILILQVASKCQPRGSLIRGTGEPHDAKSLSMRTRAPAEMFDRALLYFSANGWVSKQSEETSVGCQSGVSQPTVERQADVTSLSGDCGVPDDELKGIEGTEGNGKTGVASAPVTAPNGKHSRTPTLAEWVEKCHVEHPDWPMTNAESAWRHYESVGWRKGKSPIVKWQQCVATCYRNWKDRGFGERLFGRPVAPVATPPLNYIIYRRMLRAGKPCAPDARVLMPDKFTILNPATDTIPMLEGYDD